jgi:hypothetical protein
LQPSSSFFFKFNNVTINDVTFMILWTFKGTQSISRKSCLLACNCWQQTTGTVDFFMEDTL